MLTKTQIEILKVFTASIEKKFSIKEIAEHLKSPYPLIHRSIWALLTDHFLVKDEKELISLNYRENLGELAYVESLRAKEALRKDKTLTLFAQDVLERVKLDYFIFLVFGSFVEKASYRDIDILFIIEDEAKVHEIEKTVQNIAGNFSKNFEIQVISSKSAHEMLFKREKINIMNETLNKHILLFGAEYYYRMVKNA